MDFPFSLNVEDDDWKFCKDLRKRKIGTKLKKKHTENIFAYSADVAYFNFFSSLFWVSSSFSLIVSSIIKCLLCGKLIELNLYTKDDRFFISRVISSFFRYLWSGCVWMRAMLIGRQTCTTHTEAFNCAPKVDKYRHLWSG